MALIDYKIVAWSHKGRHLRIDVALSRGSYQTVTETEPGNPGQTVSVSRYVRVARIGTRRYEGDVPRDMERPEIVRKVQAFLNKEVTDYAAANGHTVITEETDLTDYEPLDNLTVT